MILLSHTGNRKNTVLLSIRLIGGGNETVEVPIIRDSRRTTTDGKCMLLQKLEERQETNYSVKRTKSMQRSKIINDYAIVNYLWCFTWLH